VKTRRALPSIPIAVLWLLAAPAALALPVEVTFSGLISDVEGTVPGGIAVEMPFSGSLAYDPAADEDPSSPIELTGPNVLLQLDVGAASYEIATDDEPFRSWYFPYCVDGDDPDAIVPCDDHGAIPFVHWFATGEIRSEDGDDRYFFSLTASQLFPSGLPEFFDGSLQLPNPSLVAAEFLQNGLIFIGNASELPGPPQPFPSPCGSGDTGFCVDARITNATAVPEPSPAALLLLGLAVLGASKRAPRRP
jgi:hypothetical protein